MRYEQLTPEGQLGTKVIVVVASLGIAFGMALLAIFLYL